MSSSLVTRIDPAEKYSEAVIHNGTVYLAGQCAVDTSLDAEGQTADVLAQIDALLAKAGTDKTRLLMATVYLSSISYYDAMNKAWIAWVPQGGAPARATVEARLASSDYKVEIVCTAALS